jgi:hypothetical protein
MQKIMQDLFVDLLSGLAGSAPATASKGGFNRRQSASTSITGDSELDDLIGQLLSNPDVLQFIEGLLGGSLGGDASSATAATPLGNPIGGDASPAAASSAPAVASSAVASDAVEPSATAFSAAASSAIASGAVASSAVASDAVELSAAAAAPTSSAIVAGRGMRKSFARRRLALEELD